MEKGNVLFELKEKNSVKSRVLNILIEDWPLKTKQIFNRITKQQGLSVSYQAVHKVVKQLLEQKILEKKREGYFISEEWIEEISKLIEGLRDSYKKHKPLHLKGLSDFKQEGDTQILIFDSFGDAEQYRKKLQAEYFSKKEPKEPYCAIYKHLKSPLVFSEKTFKAIELVTETNTKCYLIANGNTVVDKWCADYYKNKTIRVKIGINCAKNCETMVLGDTITQIYLPKEIEKYIDEIYGKARDISKVDVPKFYSRVYEKKAKTKMLVYHNSELASQIREQVRQPFNKRVSVFDIDGTLIDKSIAFYFLKHLRGKKIINEGVFQKFRKLQEQYKNKKINYKKFAEKVIDGYAEALKGKSVKKIEMVGKEFVKNNGLKFYEFAEKLVIEMNQKGRTIAITGSPNGWLDEIKKIIPFDEIITTKLGEKDGKYTGRVLQNLSFGKEKLKVFKNYLKENNINLNESYGFGDTVEDIPILKEVEFSVVINPDEELKKFAGKNKWRVWEGENILEKIEREIT